MSITGDYTSLAEAVGEAPPRPRDFSGDPEMDAMWRDDPEMAEAIVDYAAAEDARNTAAWYGPREYERGYQQALRDNGIEP